MKKIFIFIFFAVSSVFAYEELTAQNFDSKIKGKNVIIDFYAVWCPPCKVLSQHLEDFSTIKAENVEVFKVNIDEQMPIALKYGVSALPTILFFKDSKVVHKNVGVLNAQELLEVSSEKFK